MTYKIQLGGDNVLRLIHVQNKVGGGERVVASNHPDSSFLSGVSFKEMYVPFDDLEILATYIKLVRKELDLETYRSGN